MTTFGIDNSFYVNGYNDVISRYVNLNLFAHAFFDTPTIANSIPRVYAQATLNSFPTMQHLFVLAWDTKRNSFDHFNFRNEWTVNNDTAFTLEWRHRGSYDWRKADRTNFIIDSFRSERQ